MNWNHIEGNWKQFKGAAREHWGKLTDNDFEQVAGNKDQLIGRLQEQYGITRDEAHQQVNHWATSQTGKPVEEVDTAARN